MATNIKIKLRIAENWDSLPDSWKKVKKVKKADIKYNLTDKNLISLFEPFFYDDDAIRIAMSGLHIEDRSMVATDAHKIIHLINQGGIEDGTYLISPKIAKKIKNPIGKLNDRFPDWKVIINETTDKVFSVDVVKLKTYCEAVIKGKYPNSITNRVVFMIGNEKEMIETISFDAQKIIDTLNVFLKLGNKYIYAGYISPSKGMYFTPDSYVAKNPKNGIGGANFILVMPMMGEDDPFFVGAKEVDFNTGIRVYYSFEDDQIHNADGSIAKFDYDLNSNYLAYMNDYEFNLLKRVAGNNAILPILENVCVKNNQAFANDFTQLIRVSGIFLEDGIYEIVSGALKDTEYEVSDFPMGLEEKSYYFRGNIDSTQLYKAVNEAKNYVINNDMKPTLQGIGYVSDTDGKLTINSTNSFILYSKKLDENFSNFNNVLKNPENQNFVFRNMNKKVDIYTTEDNDYFKFVSSNLSYITEAEPQTPPKYKSVIPNMTNCVLAVDKDTILEEVKKLKGEEAKNNIIFKFDKVIVKQNSVSGIVKLYTTKLIATYPNNKYEADREIASIQYDIFGFLREWEDNVGLIMSYSNDKDDELEFKANNLEIFLSTNQPSTNFYFNYEKKNGTYVVPLLQGYSAQAKYPTALPPTPISTPKFEVKVGDTFYDTKDTNDPTQIYIVSDIKGDSVLVEWLKDNKQDDTIYDFYVINSAFNDGRYILERRGVNLEAFLRPTPNFKEGDNFKDSSSGDIYLINQIPQNSNYNVEVIEKNSNEKIEFSIDNVNQLIDEGIWELVKPNLQQTYVIQKGDTFTDTWNRECIISEINDDTVSVEWVYNNELFSEIFYINTLAKGFYEGKYVLQERNVDYAKFTRLEPNFEEGDRLKDENGGTYLIKQIPQLSNYSVEILDEQDNTIFYLTIPELNENINKSFYEFILPTVSSVSNFDVQVGDTFYNEGNQSQIYIVTEVYSSNITVAWNANNIIENSRFPLDDANEYFADGTFVLVDRGVDVDEFLGIKLLFAVGDKFRNRTTNEIVTIESIPPNDYDYVLLKDENGNDKKYDNKLKINSWINDGLWVKVVEYPVVTRESIEAIIKGYEIMLKRGDSSAASIIKGYQIVLKRL